MKRLSLLVATLATLVLSPILASSQSAPQVAKASVPTFVKFSGAVQNAGAILPTGATGATFALYKDQVGGAALWIETQNVQLDSFGRYSVVLGASKPDGLPPDLFTSGEARWLGATFNGGQEQPRILLLSVPYALKAADAETIGGLPPSAFVLAAPPISMSSTAVSPASITSSSGAPAANPPVNPPVTGKGTLNFIPMWDSTSDIVNSVLFQLGTGSAAKVGINTTTPGATLDVKGGANVQGLLTLPATGTATSGAGTSSQAYNLVASSFSSSTHAAINQAFQWKAEAAGNNTTTPSGTLNLLFGSGTATPTETGLKLSSNGLFTFATGQTFPGAGTITGVTTASGSGLTGGGTSGTLGLSLLKTCATKQILQWNGTTWVCANGGTGTVTSVGVTAPVSDFTVSGSPVTGSGTLGLFWKVPPASNDTANAIVKRDATGSFNVTSINGTGTFSTNTANVNGIAGSTSFDGGFGVHGSAASINGTQISVGVLGDSSSPGKLSSGVLGQDVNIGPGGVTLGVQGGSINPIGIGVLGYDGVNGLSNTFVTQSGFGRVGVWGDAESGGPNFNGIGVAGTSDTGVGVFAKNLTGGPHAALLALGGNGASGGANNGSPGISSVGGDNGCCDSMGLAGVGGNGINAKGGAFSGVGTGGAGVGGSFVGGHHPTCSGDGCGADGIVAMPGTSSTGVAGVAGRFIGDIWVTGLVIAGIKDFEIDHPLDPANKYLLHSSVESSEMMNIYTGNVTTDGQGEAIVPLPEWFEVLNSDFRYQLTVIGQFAQAIIAHEINGHQFVIQTSLPNVKVSWQVTGIRHDAFAKANPLVVEQEKSVRERGFYLHPELYGAPPEKQMAWAQHPETMRRIKEGSDSQLLHSTARPSPPTKVLTRRP
jgi:trimeric autotransporter adhesin